MTWEDKMETFLMVRSPPSSLSPCRNESPLLMRVSLEQSETLKYLYLLFSDDTVLPLDGEFFLSSTLYADESPSPCQEYVFNTEVRFFTCT